MTNQELYEYISDSVLDADSNIVTLLLRYKELAQRLGYDKYVAFAANELNGYLEQKPDYHRSVKYAVYADVSSIFDEPKIHVQLNENQILDVFTEGGKREYPVCWECRNGVVELSAALRQNLPSVFLDKLYDAHGSVTGDDYTNVRVECSRVTIAKLFHDIRSFVALDMQRIGVEHPELALANIELESRAKKVMTTININGSNNQVATASGTVNQSMMIGNSPEQWDELVSLLQRQQVMHDEIEELKKILCQNPPRTKDEVGDKIGNWFGRVAVRAAQAGYEISIGVIVAAISKCLGLV